VARPDLTPISLDHEVSQFETTADKVALGDLEIRRKFANRVMWLFIATNAVVLAGLYFVHRTDVAQLAAKQITPDQRIVDSHVIMALLGATTVQLGTVIYTITRAIFPPPNGSRR